MLAKPLQRSAFTLIELLVVIAIIALLIAILLPGLGAARERGKRARCAANLHQIGVAWQMYLNESVGVFPKGDNNMRWFYGGKVEIYNATSAIVNPRPLNLYLSLDGYGNRAADIFHCPSDKGAQNLPDPNSVGLITYDYYGNSYPMNNALLSERNRPPVRTVQITQPDAAVVLAGDHQMIWTPGDIKLYSAFWHDSSGTSMNLAFLDGHAAFTQLTWGRQIRSNYSFALQWFDEESEDQ